MASGWIQFRQNLSPAHRALLDEMVQKLVALSKRRPADSPGEIWWRWILQANPRLSQEQCRALAAYAIATCDGSVKPGDGSVRPRGGASEVSQMDMQRLQQAMSQHSQMMAMISNIMKAQQSAMQSIVSNLR
jgi:hypothetical protein